MATNIVDPLKQKRIVDPLKQTIVDPLKVGDIAPADQTEKLTEAKLKEDPRWIKASKVVYKFNEGDDAPDLDSDLEYANYGLRYMGWFNYNLPKMGWEGSQLEHATDEQKQEFVNLMDLYDEKTASLAGFGRAVTGVLADPTTYAGITTFGAGTVSAQATKLAIKEAIKAQTKESIKKAGVANTPNELLENTS